MNEITQQGNKRILKNTLLLYFRMLLTVGIGLYTSRVVLQNLGVEDYGIYNVVGGIVAVLSFFNGTLNTASTRFINVSLANNDILEQRRLFSSILLCNVGLALFVVLLAETVGLYFLFHKMQIPEERMFAAVVVYQVSLITVAINLVCIPYNAAIIAHEKMKAFAYMAVFDAFAKLGIAFCLTITYEWDKLIVYAILLLGVQLVNRVVYATYCHRYFPDTKWLYKKDIRQIKRLACFISWSAYGSVVSVSITQGVNILLNMFCGPAVNAARGIAVQVQQTLYQFQTNFQTAINPQMMKAVAVGDFENSQRLLLFSSKFSFFLMSVLCIPFISATQMILNIWLGSNNVPLHTAAFVKIILIMSIWQSLANPLRIVNQAEGNIKKFQILECTWLFLIVPLSLVALKMGFAVEIVFIIHLIIEISANFIRISVVCPKIEMKTIVYVKKVYFRIFPVFVVPFVLYWWLERIWNDNVLVYVAVEFCAVIVILLWGVEKTEYEFVKNIVLQKLGKKKCLGS